MASTAEGAQQQQVSAKEYRWYNSYTLPVELQCGVIRLELSEPQYWEETDFKDFYVSTSIVCNQLFMHDPPLQTLYSQKDAQNGLVSWEQLITFPIKVRDLSADALLVVTIYAADGKLFGGTSMRLFDEDGCLKQGRQKLLVFPDVAGDPTTVLNANKTPGDYYEYFRKVDYAFQMEKIFEKFRIKAQQFPTNKAEKTEWLDRLLLRRIDHCQSGVCVSMRGDESGEEYRIELPSCDSLEYNEMKQFNFLIIEMPSLQFPVIYEEKPYPAVEPHRPPTSQQELLQKCIIEKDSNSIEFSLVGRPFDASWLTIVADWDMGQENLCEEQNRRLSHNVRRGAADSSVKPNRDEKLLIDKIIQTVGNQMSTDQMNFLYRFRYSLTENKKALIKFLYCVNWDEENEVEEVPILLNLWKQRSPIDVADALKLLSKDKAFEHSYVREYAVEVLRSASDEELLSFLLQLVQALRYEPVAAPAAANATPSPVAQIDLPQHIEQVPLDNSMVAINVAEPFRSSMDVSSNAGPYSKQNTKALTSAAEEQKAKAMLGLSPLGKFLIDRACSSQIVANFLYWYLKVETQSEDESASHFFQSIFDTFVSTLSSHDQESNFLKRMFALDDYISKISLCQREAREAKGRQPQKEQALIKLLEAKKLHNLNSGVEWVPMPLEPTLKICGLIPKTARMFSSAVYPCVIEFTQLTEPTGNPEETPKPKTRKIMFKSGDDLRQDQLIMQMISLMDRLLKKVNLDLKLLTYGILAVGQKDGIMEFVQNSKAISAIINDYSGAITDYLKEHNPDKNGPYEISAVALDTFVKSCAGYCVITFILGIGDRHLDNIMMNTSGQLFHIDFGFIFGQDPKPFPPPFRLVRQMVDAMGGEDSEHYARFKTFCCQSYNWLRKSANLILNLLSLMGDAGIQDISKRSELSRVLLKVEEKFRLDLTDEQAEQYFLGLINESLHSLAPKIMEFAHKIAVRMR